MICPQIAPKYNYNYMPFNSAAKPESSLSVSKGTVHVRITAKCSCNYLFWLCRLACESIPRYVSQAESPRHCQISKNVNKKGGGVHVCVCASFTDTIAMADFVANFDTEIA